MKIIIAGAGNVGTHLAKLLSREKQDIILMDDNEDKLTALSSNFDLLTVTASPSSISGLKEVGVKDADLFIAVTPDESRNMTACMLAASQLYPEVMNYAVFGHCGDETGHKQMLENMGASPLLNLGLRLGEGTGAVCAYPIIESAVRMMNEMDNFEHAEITKYF